jgi:hypothetical protein
MNCHSSVTKKNKKNKYRVFFGKVPPLCKNWPYFFGTEVTIHTPIEKSYFEKKVDKK